MKLRLSLVEYLNAAPLGWAFLHGPLKGEVEVVPAPPSRCADLLAVGEVDAGLIPSIEYQRIPGLAIVPGAAIAAVDAVRSVLMVRPPGREIRTVAIDTSSRTSVVLLRLILEHTLGLRPEFVPHPPDLGAMLQRCDAALLIGDAALKISRDEYEVLDLARAWIDWQGMPFVFAFWACPADSGMRGDLVTLIREAKEWGLGRRDEIAGVYADKLGLDREFLAGYLTHHINYDFGPRHIEGLSRYYDLSREFDPSEAAALIRFL